MMRTLALLFVALLTGCQGLVDGGQDADSEPNTDDRTTTERTSKDGGHGSATVANPPTASDDSDSTDEGRGTTSARGDVDSDGDTLNDEATATTVDRTSGDTSSDDTPSSAQPTADDSDSGDDVDTVPSDDTDPSSVGADDTEGDDRDANASNDDAADTSDSDDSDSDDSDSDDSNSDDSDSTDPDAVDDSDTEVPADAGAPDDTDPPDPLSVAPAIRGSLLTEALTSSDLLPFADTLSEADSIAHVPLMQSFDRSLGACEACHESDYGVWTAQKYVSLHMFEDIVTQLRFKDGGVLYCDSCHQGAARFLDRSNPEAVELWMQVNLVDKLERVDGEPHGCETCHGNPSNYELIALWSSE